MILETIFLWTGGLFFITLSLVGILILWLKYFDLFWYNARISIKSIFYDLAYNHMKNMPKGMELKKGTSWWMKYKDRSYRWEVVEVKEAGKK